MRCSPSHLVRPVLALGLLPLLATSFVCLSPVQFGSNAEAQPTARRLTSESESTLGQSKTDSAESRGRKLVPSVLFHTPIWGTYKWRIIAGLGLVILQTLLIVALLLERNRKKAAGRLLSESEERYRDVVETQTELICRYLPDTTITFVNDAYCRYFSKTRAELIGSKFVDLIPENAKAAALDHVKSLIENPRTEIDEHEVLLADGTIGWQQWIDHVISNGSRVELQGIGRDITQRKRTEEALTNSEEFNRRIVESTSDCVKVLDLDGNLIYMSERGQQLLEIDDINSYINTSWVDLWQGEDRERARAALVQAGNGETGVFQGFANTMNGSPRWWHTVITPMRGTQGNIERLLAMSRDITEQTLADKAVRESEERFAKAFRANPQPMSITTLSDGIFVDVNQSFLTMSGYAREEVIGHSALELRIFETPEHRDKLLVEPLLKSGVVQSFEMKLRTKEGPLKVLLAGAELLDLGGETCILVASTDISERKILEENLRLSEREFSTLVQNSPDIISRLDRNLRLIYISPTLKRVMDTPPEQLLGKKPTQIALEGYDYEGFEEICKEAMLTKKPAHRAFRYQNRHYWTRVIPEFTDEGQVESVMTISEDVTDRIRTEHELMKLTERLFCLQDEERRRIARELHDGTAQNLFAISVNLARLEQLSNDRGDAQQLIAECQSLGDQSLQEIRTLSYLLHPPLLDQAGLVSALQWYVEGFTKRSGIYVDLYAPPIGRLPSDIEMALFRVVQEALTNVRRHSTSETARIRLERKPDEVVLEIKDRGQGLSVAQDNHDSGGLISVGVGIPGMRQRLRQLGGKLEIASNHKGTTISATVPLPNGVNHGKNSSS